MKIGILTHYNVSSHGALLQMYALQAELQAMGHEVVILSYARNLDFVDESTKKRFTPSVKNLPYYLKSYIGNEGLGCLFYQYRKQKCLSAFRSKNFKIIPYTDSYKLDCVIVGADEVFSLENGINIMMFGHGITSSRIIAYAPSVGQTDLARIEKYGCKELIVAGLKKFNDLSARDIGTQKVLKELIDTDVSIVCDPALLHAFKHPVKQSGEHYIVIYSYQSNFRENDRILKIKEYARKHNCQLWSVGVYYKWCDKHINCDPIEMIQIFANAQAIITDTFHGTITSYIAHTPMAVFVRQNNNVKLDYLLKVIGIEDRKVVSPNQLEEILNSSIDFALLDKNVNDLRMIGQSYLEKSLL